MTHDARARAKWKERIVDWTSALAQTHSRPVGKIGTEVVFGILSSGSLQLSQIARALKEPQRLHHTLKRLSRMLSKHELWGSLEQQVLEKIAPKITEQMILAIDPGDLNRDGSPKSELRSRVHDGSTGEIVGGYPMLQVVARDTEKGTTLPLYCGLHSYEDSSFVSENEQILSTMRRIQSAIGTSRLWVIDRGGDRNVLWSAWLKEKFEILVRADAKRHWIRGNQKLGAQQIAKMLPLKYEGTIRRGSKKSIRFGLTRVSLPSHPEQKLSMIVVRHGKEEPMVLVSTRLVRGRRQAQQLIHSYLDRWACEEGYRFTKQGFALEKVMARNYTVLRNLVALALTSWAVLATRQNEAPELLIKSKRQKDRKRPRFLLYSLLQGWRALFNEARTIFYDRLRRRVPTEIESQLILPIQPMVL